MCVGRGLKFSPDSSQNYSIPTQAHALFSKLFWNIVRTPTSFLGCSDVSLPESGIDQSDCRIFQIHRSNMVAWYSIKVYTVSYFVAGTGQDEQFHYQH